MKHLGLGKLNFFGSQKGRVKTWRLLLCQAVAHRHRRRIDAPDVGRPPLRPDCQKNPGPGRKVAALQGPVVIFLMVGLKNAKPCSRPHPSCNAHRIESCNASRYQKRMKTRPPCSHLHPREVRPVVIPIALPPSASAFFPFARISFGALSFARFVLRSSSTLATQSSRELFILCI